MARPATVTVNITAAAHGNIPVHRSIGSCRRLFLTSVRASQKSKRKKAKANRTPAYVSSTLSMATQNLFNVFAITAVSGMVLLALLAAKHF